MAYDKASLNSLESQKAQLLNKITALGFVTPGALDLVVNSFVQ